MPAGAPRSGRASGLSSSRSRRRYSGASPVKTTPRSTRRQARGVRWAPASAAIASAAASACWVARPPCLIGPAVASPAAKTSRAPVTRPCSSTSMKPSASAGRPAIRGPCASASAITASATIRRPSRVDSAPPTTVVGDGFALEADAGAIQQARERVGGHRPEDVQRPRLGGDDRELGSVRELMRGEQRQFVERQRPAGAGRQREQHPLARPAQRSLDRARAQRPAERGRAGHALDRSRPGGNDQAVIAEAPAVCGANLVAPDVDGGEGSAVAREAELREPVRAGPAGRRCR